MSFAHAAAGGHPEQLGEVDVEVVVGRLVVEVGSQLVSGDAVLLLDSFLGLTEKKEGGREGGREEVTEREEEKNDKEKREGGREG